MSGCPKVRRPASSRTSPRSSACASRAASVPSAAQAAVIAVRSFPAWIAAITSARRAGPSSSSMRAAKAACRRLPGATGPSTAAIPARWS